MGSTLYRNFANRRELLEALYVDEIDAVCQAAATSTEDSAKAILVAWLHRFYAYFTSKRFVAAELLEHADRDDPVFGAGRARVLDASRPLLRAAQNSGEIHSSRYALSSALKRTLFSALSRLMQNWLR